MSESQPLRLVLFSRPGDPLLLAELICQVTGMNRIDAMQVARMAPGVLPLELTADEAQRLAELVQGAGVQTATVNAAELPDLSQATVVHHARFHENGWEILELHGRTETVVLWSRIALIAIGEIPQEATRRYPDENRPTLMGAPLHATAPIDVPLSASPEMWVLTTAPVHVYCVEARHMNYETLGDAMSGSASANFYRFAQQLTERATHARRTPSTRAYLERRPHSEYAFATSAELQHTVLLHWVLSQVAGT